MAVKSASKYLQILDFRADWDLQVNQPVAGNYYPVCFTILFQLFLHHKVVLENNCVQSSEFDLSFSLGEKVNHSSKSFLRSNLKLLLFRLILEFMYKMIAQNSRCW